MTQTNCIIFIFIFKMLFWGNNCLLISSQEQPDANMQNAETVITTDSERLPRAPASRLPSSARYLQGAGPGITADAQREVDGEGGGSPERGRRHHSGLLSSQ